MADEIGKAVIVKNEKPIIFKFRDDGEQYMIGSQVGHFMKLVKGALYKRFPTLWKRSITPEERRLLSKVDISYSHLSNANILLVKANEVEDILKGKIKPSSAVSSPKRPPGRPPKTTFYKTGLSTPISVSSPAMIQLQAFGQTSGIHLNAVGNLTTPIHLKTNIFQRQTTRQKIMPFTR